jgi:sulfite exporter TauE/SafE
MVYSVLATAMLSGSAGRGALVMLAFGLGTLPSLFTMGMAGEKLREMLKRPAIRHAAGALVLGFGLLGLGRAALGMHGGWLDLLCVTPGWQA